MALRGSNYWPARYLEKRNEIVDGKGSYDVVMVGDSITHRWEREGGEGRELFAEIRKTYNILNLGYGGDRTEHVAWRMENGELEGYTAKLFTVMIGTNNGARDIAGIAGGVKRIIEDIRNKHPESKIVLMPIFPRAAEPSNRLRVGNAKISEIIRGYADGKTVLWLDFNDKFLKSDGTLTKEVMNDLLHPNEKGYAIWWEAMHPVFRDICGK
jgi:beta-glucosidase